MTRDTPRKDAIISIQAQIQRECGRKLSMGYIVRLLRKDEAGDYYVEYKSQRYGGAQARESENELSNN